MSYPPADEGHNHRIAVDFITSGLTKEVQAYDENGQLTTRREVDHDAVSWMVMQAHTTAMGPFAHAWEELRSIAKAAETEMSPMAARIFGDDIERILRPAKCAIIAKASETLIDKRTAGLSIIDKLLRSRTERIYSDPEEKAAAIARFFRPGQRED